MPQGAPESPLIFTMVADMVLRRLFGRWKARGEGWTIDGVWVCCVCYADDIILIARSAAALARMCNDLITEFKLVGLGVGAEKTHWTSTPPQPGAALLIDGCSVKWEPSLVYVGTVIDMTGSAGPALAYRMAAGARKLEQWRDILLAKWLPLRRRAALAERVVWSAVLWCAQTWHTTAAQRSKLDSWGGRVFARIQGCRRGALEDIGAWWRGRHRRGHELQRRFGMAPLSSRCLHIAWTWGGHVARMGPSHWLASLVRSRSIQWWRWRQARHHDKWTGVHPRRFKASRWESQLSDIMGDGCAELSSDNSGWWLAAQDRQAWRATGLRL